MTYPILSKDELLAWFMDHRALTRKVIQAFPEHDLFHFSIGGMRPFAQMVQELLAIARPGFESIVSGEIQEFNESLGFTTKDELLNQWDADTPILKELIQQISEEDFLKRFNLFGQYENRNIDSFLYFIENEIHHRGQAYVYLRALGIEPPAFWDKSAV